MMVLRMGLEMVRQIADSLAKQRNLHFRRTSVLLVSLIGLDDLFFFSVSNIRSPPFL